MIECVVPRRTNDRQTYLVAQSRAATWVSRTRNGCALLRGIGRSVWSGSAVAASHPIDGLFKPRFRPSGVRAFSRLAGVRPFLRADGH
jgi:hypothetical protein